MRGVEEAAMIDEKPVDLVENLAEALERRGIREFTLSISCADKLYRVGLVAADLRRDKFVDRQLADYSILDAIAVAVDEMARELEQISI